MRPFHVIGLTRRSFAAPSVVAVLFATGCSRDSSAPVAPVETHTTVFGRVLTHTAVPLPGAAVWIGGITYNSEGAYTIVADTVTADANANFTITITRTSSAAEAYPQSKYATVTVVGRAVGRDTPGTGLVPVTFVSVDVPAPRVPVNVLFP